MMIWWWERSQKGVTDGRTDGRTVGLNHYHYYDYFKSYFKMNQHNLYFQNDNTFIDFIQN